MIKFVLQGLKELGFENEQIYTTFELRMKCGIGKCGRCNIGSKYVCKDGPVFRYDQVEELPNEYQDENNEPSTCSFCACTKNCRNLASVTTLAVQCEQHGAAKIVNCESFVEAKQLGFIRNVNI